MCNKCVCIRFPGGVGGRGKHNRCMQLQMRVSVVVHKCVSATVTTNGDTNLTHIQQASHDFYIEGN